LIMTNSDHEGKSVVVTGAAGGMGRAIALAYAAAGASVLASDVDDAGLAETRRLGADAAGTLAVRNCDVRDETAVAALIAQAAEQTGTIDILVNNAAMLGNWVPIAEQSRETLDQVFSVNVAGAVFGMKHALRYMIPRKAGVIVNIASVQGFRVAYSGAAFYAASKAALVSLTKSAAIENGQYGIRVVGLAPGPIDTPMLRSSAGEHWPPPIINDVPLAKIGEVGDIARTVLWLSSDDAAYISGATLPVDGGWLAV
jgi:NAD(P)-dependent dehydrogenase (short-subunit alcohol dehydrogenase family)